MRYAVSLKAFNRILCFLGLGFNIRGGVDQPLLPNDDGIFVTKIRDSGSAALDGRLKEGDKITEVRNMLLAPALNQDHVR